VAVNASVSTLNAQIYVYGPTASGAATPLRTIGGSLTD